MESIVNAAPHSLVGSEIRRAGVASDLTQRCFTAARDQHWYIRSLDGPGPNTASVTLN